MRKRILIAPLNWGLGHASRCVPIIEYYLSRNYELFIGSDGAALNFLKKEFPSAIFLEFPRLDVHYSSIFGLKASILKQIPKLLSYIEKEKAATDDFMKQFSFDAIISDNRYGVYYKEIPSAIISHQLNFKAGLLSNMASKTISNLLSNFSTCFIPDFQNHYLSGELSSLNNLQIKTEFLGCLSRFNDGRKNNIPKRDFLLVLSGPEPSRTYLEKKLIKVLEATDYKYFMVRGVDEQDIKGLEPSKYVGLLNSTELLNKVNSSKYVISRSGYSSILDLYALKKKSILIPTKGQSEQEYLAKLHNKNGLFICMNENKIDLKNGVDYLKSSKLKDEVKTGIDYSVLQNFI